MLEAHVVGIESVEEGKDREVTKLSFTARPDRGASSAGSCQYREWVDRKDGDRVCTLLVDVLVDIAPLPAVQGGTNRTRIGGIAQLQRPGPNTSQHGESGLRH